MPPDPAATMRALRACRDAMIEICMRVAIGGAVYRHAMAIMAAIDGLAAELTGDSTYFHPLGAGATEYQRRAHEAKMARERGESPWKQ
jgi:hypothetical protein